MPYIVYQTTNQINNRIYVGVHKTTNPDVDDGYRGSGRYLREALEKYGKINFVRETLFSFESKLDALNEEAKVVTAEFVDRKNTYNLTCGGGNFPDASGEKNGMFGKHHSPETCKEIGDTKRGEKNYMFGKHHTDAAKKKMGDAKRGEKHNMFGKHLPKEHRKKISDANYVRFNGPHGEKNRERLRIACTGWHHTDDALHKMSESTQGENHPMYGKHHTKESREKNRESHLGEKNHFYGKHHTNESRRKIRESKISPDVVAQRLRDIEAEPKTYGWKSRLSKKWGIRSKYFIKEYAPNFNNAFSAIIEQRRLDVAAEPKTSGWKVRLARKWGITHGSRFINTYASDLIKKEA